MTEALAPTAFREQLLAAMPRLRRYAHALVHESAQADDLIQNTLERALTHWHQFDPHRDMVVWVLSIAHNAHLDARRRDARLTVMDPQDVQLEQDQRQHDLGVDVGLRMDLLAALNRLSPEQREPLLLVSVEQLTYAECAQVMNIPVGTVMSRVCRARALMRQWLEGDEAGPGRKPLRRVV